MKRYGPALRIDGARHIRRAPGLPADADLRVAPVG